MLILGWPTASDRRYTLLQAPSLQGPCISVPEFTDLPGPGNAKLYRTETSSPARFYGARWL